MVKYRAALWSFLKLTALVFYHVWHSPSLESFSTYKLKTCFFRQIATWFFNTKSRKNTPLWNLQADFISTDWVGWWFSRFFAIFVVIWRHFLLQNLFFIFCQMSDFPCLVSSFAELMLELSSFQEVLIVIFKLKNLCTLQMFFLL